MSWFGLLLLILGLGASVSLQQKTATRVGRFMWSTGVAVGYGPRDIGFLCLVRYATPWCVTLEGLAEILTLCRGKVRMIASLDAEVGSCRLTDFDTPGQILTIGDKTTPFSAVSLKKVRVL
jgi:hypothetical protein